MKDLFNPSSVAVIGVSTKWFNLGRLIVGNLMEFKYTGIVHLVGREGGALYGRKIHASLDDIQDDVDLAVILTPAKTVPALMEECGRKGIRRVIIETGGFGEFDDDGRSLGDELKRIADKYGIRFIGPNCIGIMNAANGLCTPFAGLKDVFRRGGAGIIAQSGGVALLLLNMLDNERIGWSKFAAIGNKLDIGEAEVLKYYVEDPHTSVICLYLESVVDGYELTQIARKSSKPIVVHKSNIAPLSQEIAQSHTQAMANDDLVVEAAFRQAGMFRFRDMPDYMDFVKVLQLPRMAGRRLAVVSRSGGHAVMAADAAHTYGFELTPFREEFLDEIRKHLRANVIRLSNPLDLGDLFDFQVYVQIIEHVIKQDNVDGVLFLHTYFAGIESESSRALLQAVAEISTKHDKPIALSVATEQFEMSRLHKEFEFPIFLSPGRAVKALDQSIRYYDRRAFIEVNDTPSEPDPIPDTEAIKTILERAAKEVRPPRLDESLEIVSLAGLQIPWQYVITDDDSADKAPSDIPGPFAVKLISDTVSHKSDVGGVVLGLKNMEAVREAHVEMQERFGRPDSGGMHGLLVQNMVRRKPISYELIIGGKRDPQFGPIILLGHGGVFVEVFGKTAIRMAALTIAEIDEMIDELPGSDIFRGVRNMPPIARDELKDAVLRISWLMRTFPEIDQIDVNPVIVSDRAATAVDARIFLTKG